MFLECSSINMFRENIAHVVLTLDLHQSEGAAAKPVLYPQVGYGKMPYLAEPPAAAHPKRF